MQSKEQLGCDGDRRDDEGTVAAQLHGGTARSDSAGGSDRRPFVTTCRQPGRLARGVDAADLHRHRGDAGQTQHENGDQGRDAERRFHGGRTGIAGYALVLSARAMMFVNAETTESPVTTV